MLPHGITSANKAASGAVLKASAELREAISKLSPDQKKRLKAKFNTKPVCDDQTPPEPTEKHN